MTAPVELYIAEIVANLPAGRELRADTKAWLLDGFTRFAHSRDLSLDAALGLAGSNGVDSARTRFQRHMRDTNLKLAYGHCGQDVGKLAEAVQHFAARKWPVWSAKSQPPSHATELQRLLFDAFRAMHGRVPMSRKQLSRIGQQPLGFMSD